VIPEQAAWVRENALPTRILRGLGAQTDGIGDFLLHHCACQYGPSQYCGMGKHDRCAHRTQPDFYNQDTPETYLVGRSTKEDGKTIQGGVLMPVWLAGRACRWRCSCPCHQPDTAQDRGLLFDLEAVA
jgi:hypothetical protein